MMLIPRLFAGLLLGSLCLFLSLCLSLAPRSAVAQADEGRLPLKLLYVCEPDTARAKAFRAFFERRFSAVKVADMHAFDAKASGSVDVCVLDHPEQYAGPRVTKNPLGDRDAWTTPTVFLGRAMPRLGGPWGLKGQPG